MSVASSITITAAEPIADALAAGPKSIATMMQDPKIAAIGLKRIQHILMALTGSGQVMAVLSEEASDERRRRAVAFNQAMLRLVEDHPEIAYLVSPFGAAIGIDRHSMLFLADYLAGSAEPDEIAWSTLKREGRQLIRDGVVLTTEADNRAELRVRCEQFRASTLPMLQSLQIA